MVILKRLATWLLEILLELFILSVFLIVVSIPNGPSQWGFRKDLLFGMASIAVMFMWGTGYLITTCIAGLFLRGQQLWFYPVLAGILYLAHLNYMFVALKFGWSLSEKLWFDIGGACIVFACTLAGSYALRKWGKAGRMAQSMRASQ
jgi:hypothetical protein